MKVALSLFGPVLVQSILICHNSVIVRLPIKQTISPRSEHVVVPVPDFFDSKQTSKTRKNYQLLEVTSKYLLASMLTVIARSRGTLSEWDSRYHLDVSGS